MTTYMIIFFISHSEGVVAVLQMVAHVSENSGLRLDAGVFFHRPVQVVVVIGEIGMKQMSEPLVDFAVR